MRHSTPLEYEGGFGGADVAPDAEGREGRTARHVGVGPVAPVIVENAVAVGTCRLGAL